MNSIQSEISLDEIEKLSQLGPLFINFTADWCITCKVNEQIALNSDYFDLIINSVNHTKKYEKIDKNYRIDVYLVDSSEIKDLNYKFLNNNYETDVLSFNFYEGWKDGALEKSESLFPGEKTSGLASAASLAKSAFLIFTINFLSLSMLTLTPVFKTS